MTLDMRVPFYSTVNLLPGVVSSTDGVSVEHLWFWSDGWQSLEAEADADIEEGRYENFDNMDDFIAALDN